jgi:hypothetical protein
MELQSYTKKVEKEKLTKNQQKQLKQSKIYAPHYSRKKLGNPQAVISG